MEIANGWKFYSADFSINVGDPLRDGSVSLRRDPDGLQRWLEAVDKIDDADDYPALWVVARGLTLENAIINANLLAESTPPLEGQ